MPEPVKSMERPKQIREGGFARKIRKLNLALAEKDEYVTELQIRIAELEHQLWLLKRS
jgi:hypothetical protein